MLVAISAFGLQPKPVSLVLLFLSGSSCLTPDYTAAVQ